MRCLAVWEGSAVKRSISSGVGGRPVRSRWTRRNHFAGDAGFEGVRPTLSRPSRMKASMGEGELFGVGSVFDGGEEGGVGGETGWNAQWRWGEDSSSVCEVGHGAPREIHSRIFWIASGGRRSPFGGICSSGSAEERNRRSGLWSGLPGTMFGAWSSPPFIAALARSSRYPDFCFFGP